MKGSTQNSDGQSAIDASNRVAYRILDALSHDHNFMSEEELAKLESTSRKNQQQEKRAARFVAYLEPYIDIRNKETLDMGCGDGRLCIELAERGAAPVHGIDIDENRILAARRLAEACELTDAVEFSCDNVLSNASLDRKYDLIVSKAAFEHFPHPDQCLERIRTLLNPGGHFAAVFGPLWGSPYGAHMRGFTKVPWVHFLFPEDVVLQIRREKYRPDELATRYEDIKGHLNRITVKRFREFIQRSGLETILIRLNPAHTSGLYGAINSLINTVPILHEVGSMQMLAILKQPDN